MRRPVTAANEFGGKGRHSWSHWASGVVSKQRQSKNIFQKSAPFLLIGRRRWVLWYSNRTVSWWLF